MFDSYSTAVNEDYHQIVNGSCKDTFSMNETAWQNTYNNPPTVLVQDYYKCKYTLQNSVINAIGVGSGTAAALIPAAIIIWIIIIQSCGFKKAVLRKELYTERELDHAKNWWATQMLIMRDLHFTRKRTNGPPLNAATKAFVDLMLDSDHNVEVSQHTLSRHHTYSYHTYSQYRILETTSYQRILSSYFSTLLFQSILCVCLLRHTRNWRVIMTSIITEEEEIKRSKFHNEIPIINREKYMLHQMMKMMLHQVEVMSRCRMQIKR